MGSLVSRSAVYNIFFGGAWTVMALMGMGGLIQPELGNKLFGAFVLGLSVFLLVRVFRASVRLVDGVETVLVRQAFRRLVRFPVGEVQRVVVVHGDGLLPTSVVAFELPGGELVPLEMTKRVTQKKNHRIAQSVGQLLIRG